MPNKAGISPSVKLPGTVKCNELPKSQNNTPLKEGTCWVSSGRQCPSETEQQLSWPHTDWPSCAAPHDPPDVRLTCWSEPKACAPAQPGSTPIGHRPPSASKLYLRKERVASAGLIPFQRRSKMRVFPQWTLGQAWWIRLDKCWGDALICLAVDCVFGDIPFKQEVYSKFI